MASSQVLAAKARHGADEPAFAAGFVGEEGSVQPVPQGMPAIIRGPGKGGVSVLNGHFQPDGTVFRNGDVPIRGSIALIFRFQQGYFIFLSGAEEHPLKNIPHCRNDRKKELPESSSFFVSILKTGDCFSAAANAFPYFKVTPEKVLAGMVSVSEI